MNTKDTDDKKGIDAASSSLTQQTSGSENALNRIADLERRLEAIEGIFSGRVVDKENSHIRAQVQDARGKLEVGETTTVVVEEPPEDNDGKGATHVDGVVTFIQNAEGAEKGDLLEVRFTDVQSNYAHCIALD
jgi:predicted RNA-binding protein with TRAM domain